MEIDRSRINDEKHAAFRAATELLENTDDDSLRYAALQLRRCIESIVYEKLTMYKWIPAKAARTWQPHQAFKALLAVEPDADKDSEIWVALEQSPGVPIPETARAIGVDRRPALSWLQKSWNKLGRALHAHWPYERNEVPSISRSYLSEVRGELERYVNRTFSLVMDTTSDFPCGLCAATVTVNDKMLESGEATCLSCWARHRLIKVDETRYGFAVHERSVCCANCEHTFFLVAQALRLGGRFVCPKCNSEYEIVPNVAPVQITPAPPKADSSA